VSETLLHAPYVVPLGQREVAGRFKAAPDFRLIGGNLGSGYTAFGLVTLTPGARKVRVEVELDGSALNLQSPDWQVTQTRGLHLPLCDDIEVVNTSIRQMPREAIYANGVRGLDVSESHSEQTETFLNLDYQTGRALRANSGIYVHGYCTHRNGQTYGTAASGSEYESVLRPGRYIGSSGIVGYLADGEIVDFATLGEYKGCVKLVSSERVRIARCIGSYFMLQGSVYFDGDKGPHSVNPANGQQLLFPFGPGHSAKDLVIEECVMRPNLTLWRRVDDPLSAGVTLQLSWPQARTVIRNNHLWWEPWAGRPSLMPCVQLSGGVDATLVGNTFHGVTGPDDPHGVLIGPEDSRWPSQINPDWRTANQFVA